MKNHSVPTGKVLWGLSLAALGVVYGDIGTSPLYALRMCFASGKLDAAAPANVLGVLSLILWSLLILITFKYLMLVLRANNHGEGGILALMALVNRKKKGRRWMPLVILLGLFGASLLYGDGLITPAISVLSAVEGLNTATAAFKPYVVPIALFILLGLFWVQRRGTQAVGTIFGPVMVFWFLTLGVLGLAQIVQAPQILAAFSPWYAVSFFIHNGWLAFLTLGAVFLALTGGEALYADMGHFGPRPIRLGWYVLVLPALLLNYFGQGAWLLRHPEAGVDNLFYRLVPASPWCLYPMIFLATLATIIASQAVISGAFSLTRQAVQLGYCPRLSIIHTSESTIGQVYLPVVNWLMLAGTVALVLYFGNSDSLAGAYGVAVSLTMLVTTALLVLVMRSLWRWHWRSIILLCVPFALIDMAFLGANLMKIAEGGWLPISLALAMITLMTTWHRGRELLNRKLQQQGFPLEDFLDNVRDSKPRRMPGTAIFLSGNPQWTPRTLLHNFKHNKIIHGQVVLVNVHTEDVPTVPEAERVRLEDLREGFHRITIRYGFSEDPNLPAILKEIRHPGLNLNPLESTFFLGRETMVFTEERNMSYLRKDLFAFLARNACDASKFFHLPPNRVIEVGIQVEL
jgi:KUP system potassium uptake protein